jgi:rhamnogalacturonyl hydrolase YesR
MNGLLSLTFLVAVSQSPGDVTDKLERAGADVKIGVTRLGTPIEALTRPNLPLDDKAPHILFVVAADMPRDEILRVMQPVVQRIAEDERSPWSAVHANPDGLRANTPGNSSKGDPSRGYPPKGESYNSPTDPEAQYLWRWIGMQAPDLVVEVVLGDGETWHVPVNDLPQLKSLAEALPNVKPLPTGDDLTSQLVRVAPCGTGVIPAVRVVTDSPKYVETLSAAVAKVKLPPSPARVELQKRAARSAKQIADQLLEVYGKDLSSVAYIPALAVVGRMRQERIDGGPQTQPSAIVMKTVEPYLAGKKPTHDPKKPNGSGTAGHLLFGELADSTGDKRFTQLVVDVANMAFDADGKPREAMPAHNEMSDAVFMGCPILAQAGKLTGDDKYLDACLRNLRFMEKLCLRDDGIYRHSPLDEAAWGRGNGFPALGLCWSLDELPESFAGRDAVLAAHVKHLEALLPHQDATGMWHQVIDRPESYREFTATAMITYAMMRGVRQGRLRPEDFTAAIDRAWEALKLRIAPDGSLVDVCTGTGKQKSLRDYYDRGAILGRDPRGGAMALMVVTERELYEAASK